MPSDHSLFNCSQSHEHDYVIRQYPLEHRAKIREYLNKWCANNTIYRFTHEQVYSLIKARLGLERSPK